MRKSPPISYLLYSGIHTTSCLVQLDRLTRVRLGRNQAVSACCYKTTVQDHVFDPTSVAASASPQVLVTNTWTKGCTHEQNVGGNQEHQIGKNLTRKDKINILVSTLLELNNSKEAVYGALDAWVAWEQKFPIASLKMVLLALQKEQQWHRVVQVIKWMLSKGQGTTLGTYGQLIKALDMDHRAEEAHKFWESRIGTDLHSVPWQLCRSMIAIYYRNNMLNELIRLFEGLEAFDRPPLEKTVVLKVANAYEMLGFLDKKDKVLEKYSNLFTEKVSVKSCRKASSERKK